MDENVKAPSQVESAGNVDEMVEVQYGEELLPVKLTEADRLERADLIAKDQEMIEKLEVEKKAVNDRIKAELSRHSEGLSFYARELRKGTTDKMVNTELIKNFRTGTITKKRNDTDEILNERAMTDHERQLGLKGL